MEELTILENQIITVMSDVKKKHDTIFEDLPEYFERFKEDVLRVNILSIKQMIHIR